MKTIIKDYQSITNIKELQREKITLCEYNAIGQILEVGRALTFQYGVAMWFKRHGAHVELQKDNINWLVSI